MFQTNVGGILRAYFEWGEGAAPDAYENEYVYCALLYILMEKILKNDLFDWYTILMKTITNNNKIF